MTSVHMCRRVFRRGRRILVGCCTPRASDNVERIWRRLLQSDRRSYSCQAALQKAARTRLHYSGLRSWQNFATFRNMSRKKLKLSS